MYYCKNDVSRQTKIFLGSISIIIISHWLLLTFINSRAIASLPKNVLFHFFDGKKLISSFQIDGGIYFLLFFCVFEGKFLGEVSSTEIMAGDFSSLQFFPPKCWGQILPRCRSWTSFGQKSFRKDHLYSESKEIFNKTGQPRPLFHLFSSFQTHISIFAANKCEKMSIQYTVPGFKLTTFGTWVSSHNH